MRKVLAVLVLSCSIWAADEAKRAPARAPEIPAEVKLKIKDAQIAERDALLAARASQIAERDAIIAAQARQIAKCEAPGFQPYEQQIGEAGQRQAAALAELQRLAGDAAKACGEEFSVDVKTLTCTARATTKP
jgi:hypothetical protein